MKAKQILDAEGTNTRVVSMPSTSVFDRQSLVYKSAVLPDMQRKRIAIEAGATAFWRQYVGLDGAVIGIDRFGASAPAEQLYEYFGITVENVVKTARAL